MTSGGTEALFCAIQARRAAGRRGDPARAGLRLLRAGGRARRRTRRARAAACRRTSASTGSACATRSRRARALVIVNSPHNPTGAVLSRGRPRRARRDRCATRPIVRARRRGLRAHGLRRAARTRACSRHAGAARRAASSCRPSARRYHATGWKVGYCVAPPALHARVPQGAPVRAVRGRDADAGRRSPISSPSAPRTACELPAFYQAQARPLLRACSAPPRFGSLPSAGHLLPARGLLARSATCRTSSSRAG